MRSCRESISGGNAERYVGRLARELRHSPEWADWEANVSHKYVIESNGLRYPVKKIVSMATGAPVSSFSGGNKSNSFAEETWFPCNNA
jgi:hypothetical protein